MQMHLTVVIAQLRLAAMTWKIMRLLSDVLDMNHYNI